MRLLNNVRTSRLVFLLAALRLAVSSADGTVRPTDFGAVYDGRTDCSAAIQKCLDLGGTVLFEGCGTARVDRTVHIRRSGTWLKLDRDFCVMLGDQVNAPILDTPGAAYFYDDPRVGTERLRGLTITGGIFDGNARNQTKGHNYLMPVLRIVDVDDFRFENVWLRNPRIYATVIAGLDRFAIRNIRIHNDFAALNCDGLHFGGHVYNGVIDGITGNPADDMIGLNVGGDWKPKSNNPREEQSRVGGATNVVIRNLHCEKGCFRAVRLLCNDKFPIDDVTIDGVTGETHAMGGVIGLTNWSEPAHFGKVVIRNVNCTNAGDQYSYLEDKSGSVFWIGNDASHAEMKVDCVVDTLEISNVTLAADPTHRTAFMTLPKGARVKRLSIDGVTVTNAGADLSDVGFLRGTGVNGQGKIDCVVTNAIRFSAGSSPYRAFAEDGLVSDCQPPNGDFESLRLREFD